MNLSPLIVIVLNMILSFTISFIMNVTMADHLDGYLFSLGVSFCIGLGSGQIVWLWYTETKIREITNRMVVLSAQWGK